MKPFLVSLLCTSVSDIFWRRPLMATLRVRSSGRLKMWNSVSILVRYLCNRQNISTSKHWILIESGLKALASTVSAGTEEMIFRATDLHVAPLTIIGGIFGGVKGFREVENGGRLIENSCIDGIWDFSDIRLLELEVLFGISWPKFPEVVLRRFAALFFQVSMVRQNLGLRRGMDRVSSFSSWRRKGAGVNSTRKSEPMAWVFTGSCWGLRERVGSVPCKSAHGRSYYDAALLGYWPDGLVSSCKNGGCLQFAVGSEYVHFITTA